MGRAVVLGDKLTVLFFRFAGFDGEVVQDAAALVRKLREIVERGGVDAVFISSSLVDESVRRAVDELRARYRRPVIVEVPSVAEGAIREVDFMRLLRQVIGG